VSQLENKIDDRMSLLLGILFLLVVSAGLIAALNDGPWHELGMNLIAEFIGLGIAVFCAEQLIQKHKEQLYDPHRNYAYARMTRAITETFLRIVPPIEKSQLNRAEFGKYQAGYYDLPGIATTFETHLKEMFKNSCKDDVQLKKAMCYSNAKLKNLVTKLDNDTHQFFTILDPPLLEALLQINEDYFDLEVMSLDTGQPPETAALFYSEIYMVVVKHIYDLQKLIVHRATRCITVAEFQREVSVLLENYRKLASQEQRK